MIKKLVSLLTKQKKVNGVGEIIETLSLTLFWGSILNMIFGAGTFFFTTLKYVAPWFSLEKFIAVILVLVLIAFLVTYKVIAPSIWQFRGKMMKPTKHDINEVIVATSGGFDPINGLGHLTHLQNAKKLGTKHVVILSRDDQLIAKGNKPNGTFYPSIEHRKALLLELKCVDEVFINIDKDLTSTESLRAVRPQIFAKGGDRTPNSMPISEIEVCKEIGCQIVYGIGNDKTTSSSELIKRQIG